MDKNPRKVNQIKSKSAKKSFSDKNVEILSQERELLIASIKDEELKFQAFMENSPVIAFMKDSEGNYIYVNKTFEKEFGIKKEEIWGKNDRSWMTYENSKLIEINDSIVEKENKQMKFVEKLASPNKSENFFLIYKFPFTSSKNKKFIGGIGINITEQREAEEKLKNMYVELERRVLDRTDHLRYAMEYLNKVMHTALNAIIVCDLNGKITMVNKTVVNVSQYSEKELIGNSYTKFITKSQIPLISKLFVTIVSSKKPILHREIQLKRKDEETRDILLSAAPVIIDGKVTSVVISGDDITERKKSELKLKESLKNNKILLKEIHHRVKNNLQVISSLLSLQSYYARGKDINSILKESQNRIKLMALIHEKLYKSEDLSTIDFKDYVQSLVDSLFIAFGVNKEKIKVKLKINNIFINIDNAIPCGLILNELISNSFKYAFPGNDTKGEIEICMNQENDNYIMSIYDNGVGLPKGLDYKKTDTLGLQLLSLLSKQLKGTVEYDGSKGTMFTVIFPIS